MLWTEEPSVEFGPELRCLQVCQEEEVSVVAVAAVVEPVKLVDMTMVLVLLLVVDDQDMKERDQDHHEDVTVAAEADHHDVATEAAGQRAVVAAHLT